MKWQLSKKKKKKKNCCKFAFLEGLRVVSATPLISERATSRARQVFNKKQPPLIIYWDFLGVEGWGNSYKCPHRRAHYLLAPGMCITSHEGWKEHSKPCHRHISLGTYHTHIDWAKGSLRSLRKSCQAKFLSGKIFVTNIYFASYCTASSELPYLGKAGDKPGLPQTFNEGEKSRKVKAHSQTSLMVLTCWSWSCCVGLPDLRVQGNPFLNKSTHT